MRAAIAQRVLGRLLARASALRCQAFRFGFGVRVPRCARFRTDCKSKQPNIEVTHHVRLLKPGTQNCRGSHEHRQLTRHQQRGAVKQRNTQVSTTPNLRTKTFEQTTKKLYFAISFGGCIRYNQRSIACHKYYRIHFQSRAVDTLTCPFSTSFFDGLDEFDDPGRRIREEGARVGLVEAALAQMVGARA